MHKKINAAKAFCFVAAASGVSLSAPTVNAQNVVLYGIVDTAVEYVNKLPSGQGSGSRWSMTRIGGQAPSRWGIRSSEDLGNGWQATLWLESGFAPDTGELAPAPTGGYFQRQSAMGLRHATYGSLTMGRMYTTMFDAVASFAPMRLATTYEPVSLMAGTGNRENNMLKYSVDMGNWHHGLHYSFGTGTPFQGGVVSPIAGGEIAGDARAQTGYGASTFYMNNGSGFGVGFDQVNTAVEQKSRKGSEKKAFVAGAYANGKMRYFAGLRWQNSIYPNGQVANRNNFYWSGAIYQATDKLSLTGAFYYLDNKKASISPIGQVTSLPNPKQISLLADYQISKRTDIYAAIAWSRDGALNFDSTLNTANLYGYSSPSSASGLMDGQKSMLGIAAGLRVVF